MINWLLFTYLIPNLALHKNNNVAMNDICQKPRAKISVKALGYRPHPLSIRSQRFGPRFQFWTWNCISATEKVPEYQMRRNGLSNYFYCILTTHNKSVHFCRQSWLLKKRPFNIFFLHKNGPKRSAKLLRLIPNSLWMMSCSVFLIVWRVQTPLLSTHLVSWYSFFLLAPKRLFWEERRGHITERINSILTNLINVFTLNPVSHHGQNCLQSPL